MGVDAATTWATPELEQHRTLLLMAVYEHDTRHVLDVTKGD